MINFPLLIYTQQIKSRNLLIYYPYVSGQQSGPIQRINSRIQQEVQKQISSQNYDGGIKTEMTGFFEIKTNERNVLSLTLENYAFSGGAHGLTILKGLTFDANTGKSYRLKDLFKDGSDYVKRLSDIISKQIIERDIFVLDPPFKGIAPNQDFYIADKSLIIFFQLYELTAYVYGFPYFPISVYEIQEIVKEDGPLGIMIG
ncbi:DUF3298 and DUF4163 domain-containing protein [Metabacillus arenae]|uniref:DUF3298 and DUF4163 domain-containing protein n=1 Tax=Metabacillus arenae TaxID=2771434 RepID=A0A926NEK1_9BACI|nr:DUF3298 and DUF4163 domain-containing protein [Metabacillus arenae]MBD1379018.1 DUF3298 and DUF4163 domain-containing protein [Metabacillus arenae]